MARVIVENTTFPKAEGAVWEGTLADTWIELTGESTMMGCVVEALDGHTVVGAESNYISSIDDLKEQQGGSMSGWMGTLNDWFTNFGFGEFTVARARSMRAMRSASCTPAIMASISAATGTIPIPASRRSHSAPVSWRPSSAATPSPTP